MFSEFFKVSEAVGNSFRDLNVIVHTFCKVIINFVFVAVNNIAELFAKSRYISIKFR